MEQSWSNLKISDFDCILCSQYFMDPVTTGCGHTFCRGCLVRVLDHGLACPLCMTPLSTFDTIRGSTYVLQEALKILAPHEYHERLLSNQREIRVLENESEMPVFVCINAFPGVACPLYVYEPRYRLLARRCLRSTSRRFAMVSKSEGENAFSSYGTILEVKDAVHLHDGRSILTTVGIRRFKIAEKGEQVRLVYLNDLRKYLTLLFRTVTTQQKLCTSRTPPCRRRNCPTWLHCIKESTTKQRDGLSR